MAKVTFQGSPFTTNGDLPAVGSNAKDFKLVAGDLSTKTLADFKGKKVVLNIFPSIDTGVCAASVRRFNKEAAAHSDTVVLCISRDLPFAQGRFCGAEGIDKVVMLSDFRTGEFGKNYGVYLTDGALDGLLARAVVVCDAHGKVVHTELVSEVTNEPNYEKALSALK